MVWRNKLPFQLVSEDLKMDLFNVKKFRKGNKPKGEVGLEEQPIPQPEEPKGKSGCNGLTKLPNADAVNDAEDEDDDFITNEVKKRLKELRKNSFMALIPEEGSCAEEEDGEGEEAGENNPTDWRDVEYEGRQWWGGFDAFYERYCERMLFFDRMGAQQLNEAGKLFLQCFPSTLWPGSLRKNWHVYNDLHCGSCQSLFLNQTCQHFINKIIKTTFWERYQSDR